MTTGTMRRSASRGEAAFAATAMVIPMAAGLGLAWFFQSWARLGAGTVPDAPGLIPGMWPAMLATGLIVFGVWALEARWGYRRLNLSLRGATWTAAACDLPLLLIPLGWLLWPRLQQLGASLQLDLLGRLHWPGAPGVVNVSPAAYLLLLWAGPWLTVSLFLRLILGGVMYALQHRARLLAGQGVRARWLFAAGAVFFSLLAAWTTSVYPPTGDEPHYLLMTHSLMTDGDLDLADNLTRGDYRAFYPAASLDAHAARPGEPGRSKHFPLLSVLLLPAYALLGRFGAAWFMALIAAACGVLVFRLAGQFGQNGLQAFRTWLLAVTCAPLAVYFDLVYPELIAALVAGGALLAWLQGGLRGALGATLAACLLPWLYPKYIPLAVVIGILVPFTPGMPRRQLILPGVFALVAGAAYAVFVSRWSGFDLAHNPYGVFRQPLSAQGLRNAVGLLVDRDFGMWTTAPATLLGLAGLLAVFRDARFRRAAVGATALAAASFVLFVVFDDFTGSAALFSRQLIPAAMVLLPAAVLGWDAARRRGRRWGLGADLMVLAGVLTAWLAAACPVLRYLSPKQKLWSLLGFAPSGFPSLAGALTWTSVGWGLAWVAAGTVFLIMIAARPKSSNAA